MKKCLIMTLVAILLVFIPSVGAFAKGKGSTVGESSSGMLVEDQRLAAFRVDKILGSRVINLEGENIGSIDNLVVDIDTGNIVYAVLEFGGFLGISDKLFAVPWESLTAVPAEGIFILDQPKAKLENSPGFKKGNWPDIGDRRWGAGIYRFYNRQPRFHVKPRRYRDYRIYPGYAPAPYPGLGADPYGEMFDPKTIETIIGEILKVEYYVPEPNMQQGTRLIIYTDEKKPVMVYIGPAWYYESQGKLLRPGNRITVTGSMVTVDDTPLVIATSIKEGNKELQLRDKDGNPTWVGWKKTK